MLPDFVKCPKCGIDKPLSDYYKNKSYTSGYSTSSCKICHVAISVERAKGNKKLKEYKSQWHAKNKERLSDKSKKYREDNKEEIARKKREYNATEAGKEKSKARFEKWKMAHPDGVNAIARRRRARKASVESESYSTEDVLTRWGTDCHICGEPVDLDAPRSTWVAGWEVGLHLEHVIPLVIGGPDTVENVKPAHGLCNLRKKKY